MGKSMAITIRVLGFPITMGWAFPAFLAFLGYISDLSGIELVVWVVFGTFAILVHELGHALAFRRYGLESSIAFWGLGGVTIPNDQGRAARLPDRQWLVVSLAGPGVGLVLGAARALMERLVEEAKAAGVRRIWLRASEDGRPLYESMGFRPGNYMQLTRDMLEDQDDTRHL